MRARSDAQGAWHIGRLMEQSDELAYAAEDEALKVAYGMTNDRRKELALKRIADRMTERRG